MALFKKKTRPISTQQLLLQQFPRTVNSLGKRISLITTGLGIVDAAIDESETEVDAYFISLRAEITDLHQEILALKQLLNQLTRHMSRIMEYTSQKVTHGEFQKIERMVETYDFSQYLSRAEMTRLLDYRDAT